MSDLISRKALLDKLTPWLAVAEYGCGKYNLLSAICELIRRAPEANNWISVKDRLPKEYGDVLVFRIYNHRPIMSVDTYDTDRKRFLKYHNCGITHWMPLPQKPEGE